MNKSKISTPQINTPKLDFVFYGGCPSLDLFNTLRRRKDPQHATEDLLLQQDGLKKWLLKAQHKSGWAEQISCLSLKTCSVFAQLFIVFLSGIDYKTTTILLDGRRVKLELW